MADIIDSFRKLRNAWFNRILRSEAQERVWESEEEENWRETHNKEMKEEFDKQTELIINGSEESIAPYCWNDLDK